MIVLGTYVFKHPRLKPNETEWGCIGERGYYKSVTHVGDHWRADLDALYNPRHVPATIGRVSLGTDYIGIWFIDDADADDPVMTYCYDTWNQKGGVTGDGRMP